METAAFFGIIFLIIGLVPLIRYSINETKEKVFLIMISTVCGAFIMTGLILLVLILLE